jgi:hypothetical protein
MPGARRQPVPNPVRPDRREVPHRVSSSSPRCATICTSQCPRTAALAGPGSPAPAAEPAAVPAGRPIRIGYARCSTSGQELASQLDALERAECKRIFSEKISTRVKVRP